MPRLRRTNEQIEGEREAQALAATLGGQVRLGRTALRISQKELGRRVGLKQARISDIEHGRGRTTPLQTWVSLGMALGRPLAVSFSRPIDPDSSPLDVGHLAAQELLLGLGRQNGRTATFEMPTRPSDPSRSIDVALRDDLRRLLMVIEVWNRLDDLGAATRGYMRKLAEAEQLAVAIARDGGPHRVASCWVMLATAANRALVATHPETFRSRFPGSSRGWVSALVDGAQPPAERGLVWIDPAARRLFAVVLSSGPPIGSA